MQLDSDSDTFTDIILQNQTWIDTYILHLTLFHFKVVGIEILIKARSRCHKDHHKGKKEAFSVVIREAPIFPNDCMQNSEICLVRLALVKKNGNAMWLTKLANCI